MVQFVPSILRTYTLPQANITLPAATPILVSQSNPRRIAIGMYASDASVKIYPTSSGVSASNIKPYLSSAGGYWYMASEVGPLAQIDWWAYSFSGAAITILEVVEET